MKEVVLILAAKKSYRAAATVTGWLEIGSRKVFRWQRLGLF
jgi:hypothetical protein